MSAKEPRFTSLPNFAFCAFTDLPLCHKENTYFKKVVLLQGIVQKPVDEKHFYTVHLKFVNAKIQVK